MSITVQGHAFADEEIREIIDGFLAGDEIRTKQSMIDLLGTREVPEAVREPAAKRFLKMVTEERLARYDGETKTYVRVEPVEEADNIHRLFEADAPEPVASPVREPPPDSHENGPEVPQGPITAVPDRLSPLARFVCFLISSAAVLSVVSINGLYAASIAGTAMLGIILITAMVAIDLMRPFLVGIALISFRKRLWTRFAGALALALILAPLSVYTSFSMFSAEFSRGANARSDARRDAEVQRTYRETLDAEIARLRALSAAQWGLWQSECGNGGCGPQAGRLQDAAQATDAEIKALVARRQGANPSGNRQIDRQIDRAAMITTSLTVFGIPESLVVQVAPLLLALGLELAAIFGPAILLVPMSPGKPLRRGPGTLWKRPLRAGRFANPNHVSGEPS